jgi:hypothetical protein
MKSLVCLAGAALSAQLALIPPTHAAPMSWHTAATSLQPEPALILVNVRRGGGGGSRQNFNANNFHSNVSSNRNVNVNRNTNVNVNRGYNGGCCNNYNSGPGWGGVAAGVAVGAVVGAAAASTAPPPPAYYPPNTVYVPAY